MHERVTATRRGRIVALAGVGAVHAVLAVAGAIEGSPAGWLLAALALVGGIVATVSLKFVFELGVLSAASQRRQAATHQRLVSAERQLDKQVRRIQARIDARVAELSARADEIAADLGRSSAEGARARDERRELAAAVQRLTTDLETTARAHENDVAELEDLFEETARTIRDVHVAATGVSTRA